MLVVDDIDETFKKMKEKGVALVEEPSEAPWGKQAVIEDPYGNLFDLLELPKEIIALNSEGPTYLFHQLLQACLFLQPNS